MTYQPSPQQQDIYNFIHDTQQSLVIQATAGAGKSATLIGITARLSQQGFALDDILFVAFNKAIVNELQEKLPRGVKACTMHSFGMQVLKDHLGDLKVENFKYSNLIREALADEGVLPRRHKKYKEISDSIKDLLNHVRLNLAPLDEMSKEEMLNLLEDTQADFPKSYAAMICNLTRDVLARGIRMAEKRGEIDFTDMLYLPWKFDLTPSKQYSLVLLDEAQDTNQLQRWLIMRAKKPAGRAVVVGDRNQAIYGFAGASASGMNDLKKMLNAEELPLSVTWRCPRSHVELAQAVIGTGGIQAAPSAKEGTVGQVSQTQFEKLVKEGDCVMARTNRPLIAQAFAFIKAGRRAKIRGRDIGQGLIKTVDFIQNEYAGREFSLAGFASAVSEWAADKETELRNRSDLNEERIAEKVAEVRDRADVINLITENSRATSIDGIKYSIEQLFDDSLGDFILLTTVHKAKGLEFNNCFIIDPLNMPAPFGDTEGETCVLFVALTRAKETLYFVDGLPEHDGIHQVMSKYVTEAAD